MKSPSSAIISFCLIIASCGNPNDSTKVITEKKDSTATGSKAVSSTPSKANGKYEGTYERVPLVDETGACPMTLVIDRNSTGYNYLLNLDKQHYSGKASISSEGNETFLTLEGIRWSEYEGDTSGEDDETTQTSADSVEIPVGVGALVTDSGFVIQNTGNAMNYYVKFAGCDCKYINLVKRKKD